ncbi:ejaculatory bulb-specific protein 3-like [Rhodnius prolixus]|uniref:Putative chemosensory protein csp8 n=1 Tax=Rhodnius prolixus TaxID=13249 RepID=R4G3I9_RHOPR
MNCLLPICFLSMLAVACSATSTYSTSYDNLDLDEILNNSRLYTRYFQCLTNKARCTPDGKELKAVLPDALATGCAKCNEKQKLGSEKVIRFLLKNKPRDFEELEKMYDPNGTYRHKYEQEAKKLGIKV